MKFEFKYIDKNLEIYENIKIFNYYINNFFKEKILTSLLNKIQKLVLVSHEEIIFYFCKLAMNLVHFNKDQKNIYDKKLKVAYIIKYFFICLFFITYVFIFRNNNNQKKKYKFKLLIDHLDSLHELKHYKRIINLYPEDKVLIRTNKSELKNTKIKNLIYTQNYKGYFFTYKDFIYSLYLILISTYTSFLTRVNLNYFLLKLLNEYFFYRSFFKKYEIENIIMHQHYYSSNIKNVLFKQNNGKHSCLIQKNLNTQNTNGYYYHCDILFTYSENSKINSLKTFSKINEVVPVGSIFMERHFYNEKSDEIEKLDILYIAGTGLSPGKYYDTYSYYRKDYEQHLEWLVKISNECPEINIGIKHRWNNKDNYEYKKLEKSNIKIINQNLNSYYVALNSKLLFSWCSSMLIELNSIGKQGFFLDPGGRNNQFLSDLNLRSQISIANYEELKQKVQSYFKDNKTVSSKEFYCLKSDTVSKRIVERLSK